MCLGLCLHSTWCEEALHSNQDLWILPWYKQFKKKEIKEEYLDSSTAKGPTATRMGGNMHLPLRTDILSSHKPLCSCWGQFLVHFKSKGQMGWDQITWSAKTVEFTSMQVNDSTIKLYDCKLPYVLAFLERFGLLGQGQANPSLVNLYPSMYNKLLVFCLAGGSRGGWWGPNGQAVSYEHGLVFKIVNRSQHAKLSTKDVSTLASFYCTSRSLWHCSLLNDQIGHG